MEKLIIASRGDGLGERILAILNALYLSKCANYKFGFIWPDHFLTYNNNSNNKILFAISDLQKEEFMFDKIFIEKYSYKNKLRLPNGEMYLGGEGFFLKNDKLSLEEFKNGKYFQYDWGLVCNQFDL
ncbi:sugar transferase, partial [Campylobacter jejuni]|nr:sugar transferase [Campylobacter jejuni]